MLGKLAVSLAATAGVASAAHYTPEARAQYKNVGRADAGAPKR